jgi:hypothetical protein
MCKQGQITTLEFGASLGAILAIGVKYGKRGKVGSTEGHIPKYSPGVQKQANCIHPPVDLTFPFRSPYSHHYEALFLLSNSNVLHRKCFQGRGQTMVETLSYNRCVQSCQQSPHFLHVSPQLRTIQLESYSYPDKALVLRGFKSRFLM